VLTLVTTIKGWLDRHDNPKRREEAKPIQESQKPQHLNPATRRSDAAIGETELYPWTEQHQNPYLGGL